MKLLSLALILNYRDCHYLTLQKMKTLGLIGGTGWVSTIEYYRKINTGINAKLGGLEAARLLLYSVNFGEIDRLGIAEKPGKVSNIFVETARKLEAAGAEAIMICANTPHMFADDIMQQINVPFIHIGEATAKAINKPGIKKVALLGTRFTMEMDFYRDKLNDAGIQMMVPEKQDRDYIHESIINELLKDVFRPETKAGFLTIIDKLINQGAGGIVLGCTEIPLLIKPEDVKVPVLDTLDIHAAAAVDFALGKN